MKNVDTKMNRIIRFDTRSLQPSNRQRMSTSNSQNPIYGQIDRLQSFPSCCNLYERLVALKTNCNWCSCVNISIHDCIDPIFSVQFCRKILQIHFVRLISFLFSLRRNGSQPQLKYLDTIDCSLFSFFFFFLNFGFVFAIYQRKLFEIILFFSLFLLHSVRATD